MRLLIVQPLPITVTSSRGSGAANLATRDPKEIWADTDTGGSALYVDLGVPRTIDTVFLGYVRPPVAATRWAILGGLANDTEQLLLDDVLRVPDVAGQFPTTSHALASIAPVTVRYLRINVAQPTGAGALAAGVLVVGRTFDTALGREWGFGRQLIDTGTATPLPSGGFSTVDGARKVRASWTFGDLSAAETDTLEAIALELGRTAPALVIEDADRTAGLRARIHYGLVDWRSWERRNRAQTRWELSIEQWV